MGIKINSNDKKNNHLEPSEWNNLIKNKIPLFLMLENLLNMKLEVLKAQSIQKVKTLENFLNI